jgi:hypothetical protein
MRPLLLHRLSPLVLAALLTAATLGSCGKKNVEPAVPTTGGFAIEMEPLVDGTNLQLATRTYVKADGQTFTVAKFKFLVSNVTLTKADGTAYTVPNGYYLIDAATPGLNHLLFDEVPFGDYTGISFTVGLDAAHNNATFTSGGAITHTSDLYQAQTGEYLFLKMTGTSAQSGASDRSLTFDVGGNAAARTVRPAFGTNVLAVKDGHIPEIHLTLDLLRLFQGGSAAAGVNFATTYAVSSGSNWASAVADNYTAGMFTVAHIHPN